jgi:hypothetical protein
MTESDIRGALLMADPEFQQLVRSFVESPVRKPFYITQAVLLVGLFVFRLWMGPKCKTILRRLAFQLWTLVAYLVLALFAVPRFWLGSDFDRFLAKLRPVLWPWLAQIWPG